MAFSMVFQHAASAVVARQFTARTGGQNCFNYALLVSRADNVVRIDFYEDVIPNWPTRPTPYEVEPPPGSGFSKEDIMGLFRAYSRASIWVAFPVASGTPKKFDYIINYNSPINTATQTRTAARNGWIPKYPNGTTSRGFNDDDGFCHWIVQSMYNGSEVWAEKWPDNPARVITGLVKPTDYDWRVPSILNGNYQYYFATTFIDYGKVDMIN